MNQNILRAAPPRILVVGDVMIDRYISGEVKRLSPEAPVPVLNVTHEHDVPGGAANVAMNCAALGAEVTIAGFIGQDAGGDQLVRLLQQSGVRSLLLRSKARTTLKARVLNGARHMIRIDFEDLINADEREQLLSTFLSEIEKCDIVVLSDYGKGCLEEAEKLISVCQNAHKPVV